MNKNHPLAGFYYLLSGFQLLMRPGLRRFVILPFCLNLIVFAGLFWMARHYSSELSLWLQHHLPSWLQWTGVLLWWFLIGGFLLIFLYTFVTVANLISAPFNSLLSEKVEFCLTGNRPEKPALSLWHFIRDMPRPIERQMEVLVYYIPRAILLLIASFIPVIQLVALPLNLLFSAWFMTLQSLDYPTDNHQISFESMRETLNQKRLLSLTFGLGIVFFSMIPFINFLVVPAAVAGGTQLWVEHFKKKPRPYRGSKGTTNQRIR